MIIDFHGKTVVVSGGTRGIGAAIVEAFYSLGAFVYATGTDVNAIEELNTMSRSKSLNIRHLHLDFSSSDSVNECLERLSQLDCIDILINNAGVNKIHAIDEISSEDWSWMQEVNLHGPFILTKAVIPIMKTQKSGKIINIASIFGVVSKEKRAAYSTTKWGLIGFTKAVALDLAVHNILVNAVSPGFVDTELTRRILGDEGIKELITKIPQQRLADCKEIAKAVLFLASEHNTYITGQNIIVDGGFTSA